MNNGPEIPLEELTTGLLSNTPCLQSCHVIWTLCTFSSCLIRGRVYFSKFCKTNDNFWWIHVVQMNRVYSGMNMNYVHVKKSYVQAVCFTELHVFRLWQKLLIVSVFSSRVACHLKYSCGLVVTKLKFKWTYIPPVCAFATGNTCFHFSNFHSSRRATYHWKGN